MTQFAYKSFFGILIFAVASSTGSCHKRSSTKCEYSLVESTPEGISFDHPNVSEPTADTLVSLFNSAKNTIQIASFYWSILCSDIAPDKSCQAGEDVMTALTSASKNRNVQTRIAVNLDTDGLTSDKDLQVLQDSGAELRFLNFTKLMGGGVLHTKFVIVDNQSFYVGSSNMDWRSYSQIKEMGIRVSNCPQLAQDLQKVFQVYWILGQNNSGIPKTWPADLQTTINLLNPVEINFVNTTESVFMSSSPGPFNPLGRTNDIDAILDVIRNAQKFVSIQVMDYFPLLEFSHPQKYWPTIEDELKKAVVERNVEVRLLIGYWKHTQRKMVTYLKSLDALRFYKRAGIQVRLFLVPELPSNRTIPYSRVNHSKFMVTDNCAYIGTSNWSGDYFVNTAGVGFVAKPQKPNQTSSIQRKLLKVFERDWYSKYSKKLF